MVTQVHSKQAVKSLALCGLLVLASLACNSRAASGYKDLYSFNATTDTGAFYSYAPLIQGPDGAFYGTTDSGGYDDDGTVFKVVGGAITILHSFNAYDGEEPYGGLVLGKDGALYGTCYSGSGLCAYGCVFKLNTDGSGFAVLHGFSVVSGGEYPYGTLIQASDGKLYGTCESGGAHTSGTVFSLNTDGTGFATIHDFDSANTADGSAPYAGVIQGADGALYGVTYNGGATNYGCVFTVKTDGSGFGLLHSFSNAVTDGENPYYAPLCQAKAGGPLFGTTRYGGANTNGTIFSINPDGTGFTLVHSFKNDSLTGYEPYGGVIIGKDGMLYGTTYYGGYDDDGVVFKVATDGSNYQVLIYFTDDIDGYAPYAAVVQGADGKLYGTTAYGGNYEGNMFSINTDGSDFAVIDVFGEYYPYYPYGTVMQGKDGMLYGTAEAGGAHDHGAVYRVNADGTGFTVLHSFNKYIDGANPYGGLIQGTDGVLYGTTTYGGVNNDGTVFKINPDGSGFKVLHEFNKNDGRYPYYYYTGGTLTQGSDGALYGTTYEGGASDYGTVFKINTDGSGFAVLHSFLDTHIDGEYPYAGVTQGKDGVLYGTTYGGGLYDDGTVYKINTDGSGFALIHSFTDTYVDGYQPYGTVIQGMDGKLYGTTYGGGSNYYGTIYSLSTNGANFKVLYSFTDEEDGEYPYCTLIQANDGTLYGSTYSGYNEAVLFKINPDGGGFTALRTFYSSNYAGLTLGNDGNAYGTAVYGGYNGYGSIYSIGVGVALLSQPTATPNPGIVGDPVQFSVAAASADNSPLIFAWDFGDGSTGTGASTSHTYTAAGTFTATVNISNASAPNTPALFTATVSVTVAVGAPAITSSPFTISGADGVPDEMKSAATAAGVTLVSDPQVLPDVKLSIKLNFSKDNNDAIGLSGTLVVGANFNAANVPFIVDVGGVVKSFKLTSTGKVKNGGDSVSLGVKKGSVAATTKFSAKFTKGSFAFNLSDEGLTNTTVKGAPVTVPVGVIIGDKLWVTTVKQSYTATQGKSGSSK